MIFKEKVWRPAVRKMAIWIYKKKHIKSAILAAYIELFYFGLRFIYLQNKSLKMEKKMIPIFDCIFLHLKIRHKK